jgi:hypothetical protein
LSRSVDPFSKKDWYDIKAPSVFSVRNIGKTLVSRTQGTKVCALFLARSIVVGSVLLLRVLLSKLLRSIEFSIVENPSYRGNDNPKRA